MNAQKLYRQTDDPILTLFFSDKNVDALQMQIVRIIKMSTGITISRQSERDLLGIMHFMYDQHANTRCPVSVIDEIRTINKHVLDESVTNVKSGMLMHIRYLKDASSLPTPIDRSMSTTDDKSIDLRSTFI